MFEQTRPEVIARFDELFERGHPSKTAESGALVDRICAFTRVENWAAAEQASNLKCYCRTHPPAPTALTSFRRRGSVYAARPAAQA